MERAISTQTNSVAEANWTDADYETAIDGLLAQVKSIAADMEAADERFQFMRAENHALLNEIKRMQSASHS